MFRSSHAQYGKRRAGKFHVGDFWQQPGPPSGPAWRFPRSFPPRPWAPTETSLPSNRIGVGMIGLGRQCLAYNLRLFMQAADVQVVALCDVDRWRLQMDQTPLGSTSAQKEPFRP